VGDGRLLARTLNASGSARKNVGDHAGALERYAEAVGLVGESSAVAVLKNNMGECRWRLGDGVGARRLYEESMESSRASGHHLQEAVTLQNLVWVLVAEGSVDEAGTTQRRAAEIVRELNLEGAVPNMLEGMGAVSIASGGIERGATILGAASAARRTLVRPGAPNELCEFAPYLDRARREAGEAVFARAWSAGQAMKVEEAIAFAFSTNGERGAV
jgi:tetratricopeptide (TPR) repeat protein